MENKNTLGFAYSSGANATSVNGAESAPTAPPPPPVTQPPKKRWPWILAVAGVVVLVVLLVLVVILLNRPESQGQSSKQFNTTEIDLTGIAESDFEDNEDMTILGQLNIDGGFRVAPSGQPSNAQPGQIYFDQASNLLYYFNGAEFVALTDSPEIQVGPGIVSTNNVLINTGVLSLQGLTGAVALTAGSGIAIDGTTISALVQQVDSLDESQIVGEIESVAAGNGLTGGGADGDVSLQVVSANGGIAVGADSIALTVAPSGDGLSGTTSSGSGLEVLPSGLALLQGCANNEILKWDEGNDLWACSADSAGGGGANTFETINTPAGTDPVADSTNDTLNLTVTGTNLAVTGNSGTDTIDFDIVESALAGNGLGVNGNALDLQVGNGLELNSDAVRVNQNFAFTWSADHTFNLNGTENVDITSDLDGSVNMLGLVGTPSAGAGTTRGIFLQQATSADTNGLDNAIVIDNADNDLAITSGLVFSNSGGAVTPFTNIFDILGTTLSAAEVTVLDGGITESEVSGDIEAVTAGGGLTGGGAADSVTLDIASANGAIVINPNDIALTVAPIGDALSATTSSGSGLEILGTGLTMLQGCNDTQILRWDETNDIWECSDDTAGGGGIGNSFETFSAPAGTNPVADSATDTMTLLVSGSNLTITGNSGADSLTFDISESTLAGNGLTSSGDALVVNTGNGLEINGDAVRVDQNFAFTWTADHTFNLAGAEDIALNHDGTGGTVDAFNVSVTPSSSAGTLNGIVITQASSGNTNQLDAGLRINNADNAAIGAAIQFGDTGGGGFTAVIDNNGTLISGAELNLLDGHDAALVDTNDAVSTAIIGTGALNSGSITSGFGAIDVGTENITTTGTVFGNDFDRSASGTLGLGNTNATTLSICNSAGCDTINIGTNADADTINIGDSTDSLAVNAGAAFGSTATFNGTVALNSDTDWNLSGAENITGSFNPTGTSNHDAIRLVTTNATSSGTQNLLYLGQHAGASGSTEAFIVIDNAHASLAIPTGISVVSSGGGAITTAIDVSDTNIGTAINVGENTILGTTAVINFTNFDVDGAGAVSNITGLTMASGNFAQNGGGTFSTGTGAVSLNGDTTVAAGELLILATGSGYLALDSESDVYIAEEGSTDTDIMQLHARVGYKFLVNGSDQVMELTQNGALHVTARDDAFGGFSVNQSNGNGVFGVSTVGTEGSVGIGYGSDSAATVFYLDADATSEPGGAEGGMYYNNSTNKFRCFQGSAWTDCITAVTTWDTIGDPVGDGAINFASTEQTMDWTDFTDQDLDGMTFNFDNNGGTAGTDNGIVINNAISTNASGDLTTESLLLIQQLDTTATGAATVVSNGLKIDVAGSAGMTDGIEVTNSAGNLTNGINLTDTGGGTFTNGINLTGDFTTGINFAVGTTTVTQEFSLSNGLTIANTDNNDLTITENATALNIDFVEQIANTITMSSTAAMWLASSHNSAGAFTIESTVGGIDILATGAAAGEDIDVTSSASINLTSQEAASDAVVLDASANNGGIRIIAGDNEATTLGDGNDIEFKAEDDVIAALTAAGQFVIDAATNVNSTVSGTTTGVVNLSVDSGVGSAGTNNAVFIDYEVLNDANTNQEHRAIRVNFTNAEDSGDAIDAIYIANMDNASNGTTDSLITLQNDETTASTVTDALRILGTAGSGTDTIVDAIDVSDDNITNALNIGANAIAGTNFSVNGSGTITTGTLGSADSATYLCRNGSNQISTCQTNVTGSAFVQGGNTFGTGAVLGTNDNNSLSFEINNNTVQTISTAGAVAIEGITNDLNAFRLINATDTTGINISTVTPNLITNHSFEVNTTGWVAHGASTISRVTTEYRDNNASLQVATTAAANDGARYAFALQSSTQYSFSIYVKSTTDTASALEIGRSENGSTDTSCHTNSFENSWFARYTCTFTTGTVTGSPYIYVKQTDATSRTLWVDAVQLETAATPTLYANSKMSISGTLSVNHGSTTAATSNTAVAIKAIGGGDALHIQGNGEFNVFQNMFIVSRGDGQNMITVNEAANNTSISGGNAFFNTPALTVFGLDPNAPVMIVQAASSQSDDIFIVENNGGTDMFNITAAGQVNVGQSDTTGALVVLDTKTSTGDPTGTNGAMYYNSSYGRFRCYQNSVWVDCISGGSREYLRAEMQTPQTTTSGPGSTSQVDAGDHIDFDTVQASAGGSISLDTATSYTETTGVASSGRFTLAAGKTYLLRANLPRVDFTNNTGNMDYGWRDVTSGSTLLGNEAIIVSVTYTGDDDESGGYAEAIVTPASTMLVEVLIDPTAVDQIGDSNYFPIAYIEVLSDGGAGGASAAEYLRAEMANIQNTGSELGVNDHVKFDTLQASSGSSITLDTTSSYVEGGSGASIGRFTLAAGKTYKLTADIGGRVIMGSSTTLLVYGWYDITGGTSLSGDGSSSPTNFSTDTRGEYSSSETIFRPTVTSIVEIRIKDLNSGSLTSIGGGSNATLKPYAFVEVLSDGTKIAQFQGATAGTDGQAGYVPMPEAGQQGSLLMGDGTWSEGLMDINRTTGGSISLLSNNSGEPAAWSTAASINVSGAQPRDEAGATYANGYIYLAGGNNASGTVQTTVYSAKPNATGNITAWSSAGTLNAARAYVGVTTYNGFIYSLGGTSNNTDVTSTVQYAKLNPDGTTGTWATTSSLTASRKNGAVVALNGFIYYIGGNSNNAGGNTAEEEVYVARINADGSLGTFSATNSIPAVRLGIRASTANGRIFAVGGNSGAGAQTNVYYGAQNVSTGAITWTSEATNTLPVANSSGATGVMNGYLYYFGGTGSGGTAVYYAPLSSTGTVGAWTQQNTSNDLPTQTESGAFAAGNGAMYSIGGWDGDEKDEVYYTRFSEVLVGGNLNLTYYSGEDNADGSTGGSLTAGNTTVNGLLNVTGNATFKDGVSVINNTSATAIAADSLGITSTGNAFINLSADTDNDGGEIGAAYIRLSQDGGATSHFVGITQNSGFFPDGTTAITGGQDNAFLIGNTGAANPIQFLTDENVRLTISATGDITVGLSDTTGALLVLDTKTSAGDPTGVLGAMYYNGNRGKMRCFEVDTGSTGYWADCVEGRRTNINIGHEMFNDSSGELLFFTDGGVGGFSEVAGVAGHPGIQSFNTGNSATERAAVAVDSDGDVGFLLGGGDVHRFETVVRIPTLSVLASQAFVVRAGYNDASGDPTDGCIFKYSDNVNSGEWQGYCADAGSSTCDTNVAVVANTWYRLTIVPNSAGTSVDFQVNGVSACQVASQIPDTAGNETGGSVSITKTVGTTSRSLQVDYVEYKAQLTPR